MCNHLPPQPPIKNTVNAQFVFKFHVSFCQCTVVFVVFVLIAAETICVESPFCSVLFVDDYVGWELVLAGLNVIVEVGIFLSLILI